MLCVFHLATGIASAAHQLALLTMYVQCEGVPCG